MPKLDWQSTLKDAHAALATLDQARADLSALGDVAAADIARYLRIDSDVDIDPDAIRATLTRPYTLLPINENEAWLIHWRGVRMPIFGWVIAQEPAFIKTRITRSMSLVSPLPKWMENELGWQKPEHGALIDSTRTAIRITSGDETTFRRRYGAQLGAKQADGSYKIRGGDAWIKLVAHLVRDGILPYAPTPVAPEHWNEKSKSPIALRDYQPPAVKAFLDKGAILINFPPGAGKTYIVLYILNHFVGRVLILADTVILTEQWRDRVKKFAPRAEVTISTYQGASRYLDREWDLMIADEAQRLPANTFSKLAFVRTKYRIGTTGTPWREDDRQFLITALSGFPVSIPWSELVRAGVLRRPRIIVATVNTVAAKTAYVKTLLARRKGRAIVFCDWIEQGQALAEALDVPFIHGGTPRKLERLQESEVAIVSRIGDRGLDFPDLRLVIEVAGAGAAREQFAQRVGRLLHGEFNGEFFTVFTPEEAERYRPRIFGVEAELAGEVDIEFVNVDSKETVGKVNDVVRVARTKRTRSSRVTRAKKAMPDSKTINAPREGEESDEVSALMALPAIAAKLAKAEQSADYSAYVRRVFRLCFSAEFTPQEIAEGLGLTGQRTTSRLASACRALVQVDLFSDGKGRYTVRQDEVNRLRALAQAVR